MITFSEVNQYSEKVRDIYQKLIDQIDELLVKIFSKYKNFNLKIIPKAFRGIIFNLFLTNEILLRKDITKSEINRIFSSYVKIILNSINR
ncbi:MAG TPA: hypothetical protein ENG63_03550 [Candidatus Desulfofervidus auxilii]|uniref:Uncharacterized protein n=1 Tax=Desulfofervidus auxilii TaxID=1621989 RepID=A0A7C0Y472_DESA2|nr:hypothetical protein [Candidatus Desulfofervidus auxilii]